MSLKLLMPAEKPSKAQLLIGVEKTKETFDGKQKKTGDTEFSRAEKMPRATIEHLTDHWCSRK